MSTNIETVQAVYAAYGRGDMKALLELMHDEVTWGIETSDREVPPYGVRRGKAGVEKFFSTIAEAEDFHSFVTDDYVAAGDHVFNHLRYEATVRVTGKKLKQVSLQHWTLKDGKVLRWRGYEDTALTRDAYRR